MAKANEPSVEQLQQELNEALELNAELQAELETLKKAKAGAGRTTTSVTAKHKGKQYRFAYAKFYVPGKGAVTAEAASGNPEILEYLVAKKSKVLIPIEK